MERNDTTAYVAEHLRKRLRAVGLIRLVDIFRKGNTMSTMTDTKGRRTRRSFTDDYKTGAVRLVPR